MRAANEVNVTDPRRQRLRVSDQSARREVEPGLEPHPRLDPDDLFAGNPIDFVHHDDRERVLAEVRNLMVRAETVGLDVRLRTNDGTYRWIRWSGTAVPDERVMYSWGRDVTTEIEAKEDLRRQEAQLEDAQAIAHLGSWEWDFATRKTSCSNELFRIFGLDPAQAPLDAQPLFERVHPSDRERIHTAAIGAMDPAKPFSLECRIVRADSVERIVHFRGRFVSDPAGRDRMVGTIQDVTESRRAEESRRESDKRFRGVFEKGPMGVAIVDPSLRILEVNVAFADMLGRNPEDLQGRIARDYPSRRCRPRVHPGSEDGHRRGARLRH